MARFIIAEQTGSREGASRVGRGNFGQQTEKVVDPALATANSFGALEAEAQFQVADQIQRSGQVLGGAIGGAGNVVQQFADRQRALKEFDERQEIQQQNKEVELAVQLRDAETLKRWRGDPNAGSTELLRVELANNRIEEFSKFEDHGFTTKSARGLEDLRKRQLQQSIDAIPLPGGQYENFQIERAQGRIKDQNDNLLNMAKTDAMGKNSVDALNALHLRIGEIWALHTDPHNATITGGQENAQLNADSQIAIAYDNHLQGTITKANTLPWQSGNAELVVLEGWLRETNEEGLFVNFPHMAAKQRSNMIAKVADEKEKLKGTAVNVLKDDVAKAKTVLSRGGRTDIGGFKQRAKALDQNGKLGLGRIINDLEIDAQIATDINTIRKSSESKFNGSLDNQLDARAGRLSDSPAQARKLESTLKMHEERQRAKSQGDALAYFADAEEIPLREANADGVLPDPKGRAAHVNRLRGIHGEEAIDYFTASEYKGMQKSLSNAIKEGRKDKFLKELKVRLQEQILPFLGDTDEAEVQTRREISRITARITRLNDPTAGWMIEAQLSSDAKTRDSIDKVLENREAESGGGE
jgi:hypothetical protein